MKNRKQLIAYVLSIALAFGMLTGVEVSAAKKASLSTTKLTITKGKSKTLTVKNTKQKVTWKILSGKKYITLKKNGNVSAKITGKKKGTAKVQAKFGNKRLTCKVTVKDAEKPQETNTPKPTNKPVPTATTSTEPTVSTTPITPSTTPTPINPDSLYEPDVTALKALITEQRGRGATVSEDITCEEYKWEDDGRLTELSWNSKKLKGDISFSSFAKLEYVDCCENELISLDVSKNVALAILRCDNNQLISLDVSKDVALVSLCCGGNQLTSLDVSKNMSLGVLLCSKNLLTSLDVSKNVELSKLYCDRNLLTSLDVSKNVKLYWLYCEDNLLTSLDVSKNVALALLWCDRNLLTSLDLTNNTKLNDLSCDDNVTVTGYKK